jgi:hypothetical protein
MAGYAACVYRLAVLSEYAVWIWSLICVGWLPVLDSYAGPAAWLTWLCWKDMIAGYSEWFCRVRSLSILIMLADYAVYPEELCWLS